MMFYFKIVLFNLLVACLYCCQQEVKPSLPDGFVYIDTINPNIIVNLRYFGKINFVGDVIDGYKINRGILTTQAANALNYAWQLLDAAGYNIVVYDAYRPQKAVDNFVRWANNTNYDRLMKLLFFPYVDHDKCFELGYIAEKSGHTRGSTFDISIIRKDKKLQPISYIPRTLSDNRIITFLDDGSVDMGSSFDLFDEASWSNSTLVNSTAQANRKYLIDTMRQANFSNYALEWWHFTLINEPYPNGYFNFDIKLQSNIRYFHEEILDGFHETPVCEITSQMLLAGTNAQAVFTYKNPPITFLGAAEYGRGRMFLAAHDCYCKWFENNVDGLEGKFISNVKKWLTKGAGADDSQILNLYLANENTDFNEYRLAFWHPSVELNDQMAEKLRNFVANGGGLFAGITFWATAASDGDYDSSSMYRFFKKYAGLVLVGSYSFLPNRVPVHENQARVSSNYHKIPFLLEDKRSFIHDEILEDLSAVPVVGAPGKIILVGQRAQALFTSETRNNVFLGVSEYGQGRMFLAAHSCYCKWFENNVDGLEGQFINNVKKWLTKGSGADVSNTLDLRFANENTDFNRHRLCFWHPSVELNDEMAEKLRNFVANGGGLFAGITFWASRAAKSNNNASSMYRFFKNYAGLLLTNSYFTIPTRASVIKNQAGVLNHARLYNFENRSSSFYVEILQDLSDVPVLGAPGKMNVVGQRAQALFTGETLNDVFLGVSEYGQGRMFLAAHDRYCKWFENKVDGLEGQFINNVKKWLTKGSGADDSNTLDLRFADKNTDFNRYKLCFWHSFLELTDEVAEKLRNFIANGGGLFAGITFWATEAADGDYDSSSMYRFFKNYAGLVLVNSYFLIPTRVPVIENQADKVNYNHRLELNNKNFLHYCRVVAYNLEFQFFNDEVDFEKARRIKNALIKKGQQKNLNFIPSTKNPIKSDFEKIVTNTLCMAHIALGEKADNIAEFPGDFSQEQPMPSLISNISIKLKAKFAERISTGYYLPAGIELTIMVMNGDFDKWNVRIGPHTDVLTENNHEFRRWPVCTVLKHLKAHLIFSSPFGGLVYFESSEGAELEVIISNVVEAPYFDVTNPEHTNNWETIKNKPGLWAEIAGKYIIFTTPSSSIRDLDDVKEIINYWDELVWQYHEFRGTSPGDQRRERIVPDEQLSQGHMHAGYPIMTHLDIFNKYSKYFVFNIHQIKRHGNWGIFHELGHQMQRSEWTFDGAGEVTNNIFTLYGIYIQCKIEILENEWFKNIQSEVKTYFSKQPTYEDWKNDYHMGLATFVQLILAHGWQPMQRFMKDYEYDIQYNRTELPTSNQDKIDQWVIRYSKTIKRNIKPQFEMWGLPVSSAVDHHVASFEPFAPKPEDYLIVKQTK